MKNVHKGTICYCLFASVPARRCLSTAVPWYTIGFISDGLQPRMLGWFLIFCFANICVDLDVFCVIVCFAPGCFNMLFCNNVPCYLPRMAC